jgi:hypothetical protein
VTLADVPGYLFLDLNDNHATVVHPPRDQSQPRISKLPAKLSDEDTDALVAGRSARGSLPHHRGPSRTALVPDKRLAGGEMASAKVMEAAMQTTRD